MFQVCVVTKNVACLENIKENKESQGTNIYDIAISNAFGHKRLLKMTSFTLTMSGVNFVQVLKLVC